MLDSTIFLFLTDLNLCLYILRASLVEEMFSCIPIDIIDELWLSRAVNAEMSKLVSDTCSFLLLEYSLLETWL
jgi:hypothetical protein